MSDVSVWSFFAFMNDDGEMDEKRRLADWQVQDAVRWAAVRGYDNIYLYRDKAETDRFTRSRPLLTHHMDALEGSRGEQERDAA